MMLHDKAPQKSILVATVGTLLEWAEYTFYGYMAITIAQHFFPNDNPVVGVLQTFGIFALGYIMRPLGAVVFGHIGDRKGRKTALMISMIMMGLATLSIAFLPDYNQIGLMAPLILLLLRLIQGAAVSGEYNGASVYLIEQANEEHKCFAGSLVAASAAFGMVVGGLAAFIVSLPALPEWSYRVPFLLGGVACFISLYFRRQIQETPDFVQAQKNQTQSQVPLVALIKTYKSNLLFVALIAAFISIFVYIANIYFVVFLKQQVGLSQHQANFYALFGELLSAILIPLMGMIGDKVNYQKQFQLGLVAVIFFSPMIFLLAKTGNHINIFFSMSIFGLCNGWVCGPLFKILYDEFPPLLRYSGCSIAWSISAAIFGGTAPLVSQYIVSTYHWTYGPSIYISLMALLTLIGTFIKFEKPVYETALQS